MRRRVFRRSITSSAKRLTRLRRLRSTAPTAKYTLGMNFAEFVSKHLGASWVVRYVSGYDFLSGVNIGRIPGFATGDIVVRLQDSRHECTDQLERAESRCVPRRYDGGERLDRVGPDRRVSRREPRVRLRQEARGDVQHARDRDDGVPRPPRRSVNPGERRVTARAARARIALTISPSSAAPTGSRFGETYARVNRLANALIGARASEGRQARDHSAELRRAARRLSCLRATRRGVGAVESSASRPGTRDAAPRLGHDGGVELRRDARRARRGALAAAARSRPTPTSSTDVPGADRLSRLTGARCRGERRHRRARDDRRRRRLQHHLLERHDGSAERDRPHALRARALLDRCSRRSSGSRRRAW